MPNLIHSFEAIAPGPYKFIGLYDASDVSENLIAQGFDGLQHDDLCVGSCDHCGTAITVAVRFIGSNGHKFKVGETCANKAFEPGTVAVSAMKKACNARRLAMKKAKECATFDLCIQWLNDRTDLNDLPHPKGFDGLSLGDFFQWYRDQAGKAKFIEVCKLHGFGAI